MMHRIRRLFFPALIVGLVALATFGIRQVIQGPGEAQEVGIPQPTSFEEWQRVRATPLAQIRDTVREFVESDGDPCALQRGAAEVIWHKPYLGLPSLINDVDLVVRGRPIGHSVEAPEAPATAGRVVTVIQVAEMLKGNTSRTAVPVALGNAVVYGDGELKRFVNAEVDACSSDELLLFLERTHDPEVFSILYQGWARVEGNAVEYGSVNTLFAGFTDAQELLSAVRLIAQEQAEQGIPKGFLRCQAMRTSAQFVDPVACPGETFNPYRDTQLEPASEAFIITEDPGPSPVTVGKADLQPEGPELAALLRALDLEVTLEPLGLDPGDLITLYVTAAMPANDRTGSYTFAYSPSTGIVQVTLSRAQFPAPPAFQELMRQFEAQP